MDEVKMVLDVPTRTALYQQSSADDEWQTWYGRTAMQSEHGQLNAGFSISDDGISTPDALCENRSDDDQMMII